MSIDSRKTPLLVMSFGIVSGMLFASNLLGFVRELITARTFGATGATDAFFGAHALVSTFTLFFLAGTVQGALLPRYLSAAAQSMLRAGALARQTLVLTMLVAIVFAATLLVFAEPLIRIAFGGFDEDMVRTAAEAVRWLAPTILAAAWGAVFQAVLHAHRRFLIPAVVPPLSNLFVIGAILGLGGTIGVQALSIGYLAGSFVWVALTMHFAWPYLSGSGQVDPDDRRRVLRAFSALSILVLFDSLSGLVQRSILSYFDQGILSAFAYGSRIAGLPVALVATALAVVLFPRLTEAAKQSRGALADALRVGLLTTLSVLAPTAVVLCTMGYPLIDTLFGGRTFDLQAVQNTARVLAIYGMGLPGQALIIFLERAYLASERATVVVWIAVVAGLVQIAITYALISPFGWLAVPIGTCIYGYLHAGALFVFSRHFVDHDLKVLGIGTTKITLACSFMLPAVVAPLPDGPIFEFFRCTLAALLFLSGLYWLKERTWLQLLTVRS